MRKNGKKNSVHGCHGRARHWAALTARWAAALLCAYVPLVEELPPLMPAPLLNVLALLAALHALLPLDGTSRAVTTGEPASPVCRSGSAHRVRTADTCRPVRAAGSPWSVAHRRDRKRPGATAARCTHRSERLPCRGVRTDCAGGRVPPGGGGPGGPASVSSCSRAQ
ncbi:hypothetical protein ACIQFU_12855 [Streptomyces sp. NPDC093065]|uniref:hypothetical protein n=1 Tax=Streptomyces sp. NPDC093065 TaxID=3366021 RepID=UPI003819E61C